MFLVFVAAAGMVVISVRTFQALKRFGWRTKRALLWWNGVIAVGLAVYVISSSAGTVPPRQTAVAAVLGAVSGCALLIVVRPRWPQSR